MVLGGCAGYRTVRVSRAARSGSRSRVWLVPAKMSISPEGADRPAAVAGLGAARAGAAVLATAAAASPAAPTPAAPRSMERRDTLGAGSVAGMGSAWL